MQNCHFNTLFDAHQVEDVILFIFKLSKLISFIFGLFQSSQLIKYVLKYYNTTTLQHYHILCPIQKH
jgi:hypothetical protein